MAYLVVSFQTQREYDAEGRAFGAAIEDLYRRSSGQGQDRTEVSIESHGAEVLVYLGGYSPPDPAMLDELGETAYRDLQRVAEDRERPGVWSPPKTSTSTQASTRPCDTGELEKTDDFASVFASWRRSPPTIQIPSTT